jgi:hypothetical protein
MKISNPRVLEVDFSTPPPAKRDGDSLTLRKPSSNPIGAAEGSWFHHVTLFNVWYEHFRRTRKLGAPGKAHPGTPF